MLFYLDNHLSKKQGLNENYARELLELHTLGVDGGYTQQDVIEVARAVHSRGAGACRARGRCRRRGQANRRGRRNERVG